MDSKISIASQANANTSYDGLEEALDNYGAQARKERLPQGIRTSIIATLQAHRLDIPALRSLALPLQSQPLSMCLCSVKK